MNLRVNLRTLAPPWLALLCLSIMIMAQKMDIPDELDPFLELLFETSECESVVGNEAFLVVETRKCKPFTCNFPFEVCMRPSHLLNEEKANQCRGIPDACLTAANGGVPVVRPSAPSSTLPPTPPSMRILGGKSGATETSLINEHGDLDGDFEEAGNDGAELETSTVHASTRRPSPHSRIIRPNRLHKTPICEQGVPNGRFCGFQLKFTFNKATGNCEQFWFPGCPTEDTNDNLFDSEAACRAATHACVAQPPQQNRGDGSIFPTRSQPEPPPPSPVVQPAPSPIVQPDPFNGRSGPDPSSFIGGANANQFKGFMEWAGSALGGAGNARPGEYGGGQLGTGGQGVTQPPNLIRLIANSIRDVGNAQQGGGGGGNGAAVFTNILQQFG